MDKGDLVSVPDKGKRIGLLLKVALLTLAIVVQLGAAAVVPDFYAMNQANKTLTGNSTSIAYGDYLYLYDNSTITAGDNITAYNWTVSWNGTGGIPVTMKVTGSAAKTAIFGPIYTDNSSAIMVSENVTNSTGIFTSIIKPFFVTDGRALVRSDFAYVADYANRSAAYPNGTLTFRDASKLQIEPPMNITGWWWKLISMSGLVSGSWSGTDTVIVNLLNDTYLMNFTVQSSNGSIASYNETVSGMPDYIPPVANFTAVYRNGTSPQVVAFIDQSVALTNLSYQWTFGDNFTSNERNPEHVYLNRSTPYTVNLSVTDRFGTTTGVSKPDYISVSNSSYPVAVFTFTPNFGEWPLNVTFIDQSILDPVNGTAAMYLWDFGDGSVSSDGLPNQAHTYTTTGIRYPSLMVTYPDGRSDSTDTGDYSIEVINPTLQANFSAVPWSGPTPLNVTFIDQSKSSLPIVSYNWDFGDGINATGVSPQHQYTQPGLYNITLNITAASGSNANVTKSVIAQGMVYPVVKFTATPMTGVAPLNVSFIDQSILDPLNPYSNFYQWYIDGQLVEELSNLPNAEYRFTQNGTYTVQLGITPLDGSGRSEILSDEIQIEVVQADQPFASFIPVPRSGKPPLDVSFVDQSVGVLPISYNWTFGDGSATSTEQSPRHRYMTSGIYPVTLDIIDGNGKTASDSDSITVSGAAALKANFTATPFPDGNWKHSVRFIDSSQGNPDSWFWQFGDGYFETTQNVTHSYPQSGTYTVSLTVKSDYFRTSDTKTQVIPVS